MRPPYEGWGHLLKNILIKHWLAEQKMLVFVFMVFGVMDLPSLLLCVCSSASPRYILSSVMSMATLSQLSGEETEAEVGPTSYTV